MQTPYDFLLAETEAGRVSLRVLGDPGNNRFHSLVGRDDAGFKGEFPMVTADGFYTWGYGTMYVFPNTLEWHELFVGLPYKGVELANTEAHAIFQTRPCYVLEGWNTTISECLDDFTAPFDDDDFDEDPALGYAERFMEKVCLLYTNSEYVIDDRYFLLPRQLWEQPIIYTGDKTSMDDVAYVADANYNSLLQALEFMFNGDHAWLAREKGLTQVKWGALDEVGRRMRILAAAKTMSFAGRLGADFLPAVDLFASVSAALHQFDIWRGAITRYPAPIGIRSRFWDGAFSDWTLLKNVPT